MHDNPAREAAKKYNLRTDQVTAEVLQKYLREREYRAKFKNIIEKEEQIVEFYEKLNN